MGLFKLIILLSIAMVIVLIESKSIQLHYVKYPECFEDRIYNKKIWKTIPIWMLIGIHVHILMRMFLAQCAPPFMIYGFVILIAVQFVVSNNLINNAELYKSSNYYTISGESPRDIHENFCQYCDNYKTCLCSKCTYKELEIERLKALAFKDWYDTLSPSGQRKFREDRAKEAEEEARRMQKERERQKEREKEREEERKEAEKWARIFRAAWKMYNTDCS